MFQSPSVLLGPSNDPEPSSCSPYPHESSSSATSQTSPCTSRSDRPNPVVSSLTTRRYGVPPTLFLIILSPILLDCSPFQGREVAAAIPLFVCAALFCTMELARGAKALDRLADRWAQGYIHIDDPRAQDLTVDGVRDGMADVESRMSGETLNEPPRMPKTDRERVAFYTIHAGQEGSFHYKQHGLGSSESLPLSTSSQSPRTSVFEFLGRIDGNLADGTKTSPPKERGPFDGYRMHNYTLQMDPGGHQLHAHQRQTVVY
jgi:hypothetical protein